MSFTKKTDLKGLKAGIFDLYQTGVNYENAPSVNKSMRIVDGRSDFIDDCVAKAQQSASSPIRFAGFLADAASFCYENNYIDEAVLLYVACSDANENVFNNQGPFVRASVASQEYKCSGCDDNFDKAVTLLYKYSEAANDFSVMDDYLIGELSQEHGGRILEAIKRNYGEDVLAFLGDRLAGLRKAPDAAEIVYEFLGDDTRVYLSKNLPHAVVHYNGFSEPDFEFGDLDSETQDFMQFTLGFFEDVDLLDMAEEAERLFSNISAETDQLYRQIMNDPDCTPGSLNRKSK